jgi:hypothetical protein
VKYMVVYSPATCAAHVAENEHSYSQRYAPRMSSGLFYC